eukprot:TRINITY_DN18721_c0_g1_i1.p1 TRINITY_DN18721_c0_g1~~TRINITY_DN18721_c0_g1_i1.p1  ORF type:complete len:105 (-),score=2.15 TRINITY_DN18721_c0_g1_i1:1008-1322(-)
MNGFKMYNLQEATRWTTLVYSYDHYVAGYWTDNPGPYIFPCDVARTLRIGSIRPVDHTHVWHFNCKSTYCNKHLPNAEPREDSFHVYCEEHSVSTISTMPFTEI